MLCFFSAKGGVGCSVVAVAAAQLASRRGPTLLVDLHGEITSIVGVSSDVDGLAGWFQTETPSPDLLHRLEVPIGEGLALLPRGGCRSIARPERYRLLAKLLALETRTVVVDVGTASIPAVALVAEASTSVLVTRACYLAIRAARCGPTPDHVLLVSERGRALGAADVQAAIGAPVTASIPWDPAVARAVDAGLLVGRLPRSMHSLGVFL